MQSRNLIETPKHIPGHRRRPARFHAHMEADQLVGRGEIAVFGVIHEMHVMQTFCIMGEQLRVDPQRRIHHQLPVVGNMGFQCEGRTGMGLHVVHTQPHKIEKCICRVVKCQHVVRQVHVAVMVNPVWMHAFAVQ